MHSVRSEYYRTMESVLAPKCRVASSPDLVLQSTSNGFLYQSAVPSFQGCTVKPGFNRLNVNSQIQITVEVHQICARRSRWRTFTYDPPRIQHGRGYPVQERPVAGELHHRHQHLESCGLVPVSRSCCCGASSRVFGLVTGEVKKAVEPVTEENTVWFGF